MDIHHDLTKMGVSLLLGMAIGLEREVSAKAAGLRTNILISLGATLFTTISLKFMPTDAHVPAQIVAGVGFLGAGAIMREGDRVTGLTTAATIWIVAAIGSAVGFGYFILAATTAALVLFVQLAFTRLDALIDTIRERHTFKVVSKMDGLSIQLIERFFREARIRVINQKLMKRHGSYYSEWYTAGPRPSFEAVTKKMLEHKDIEEVTY